MLAVRIIPYLFVCFSGCTLREARDVADIVRELAPEVCVAHDSTSVCLRKCADEAERRGIDGPLAEPQ